jgi:ferredoxin like protein
VSSSVMAGPVPASVPERLGATAFDTDEGFAHIKVNQELAKATDAAAILLLVCPAKVYSFAADGGIQVEWAACLECGTCLAVAPPGVLEWHYPRGGFGVRYREG